MSYVSLKNLLAQAALAAPLSLKNGHKAWRVAVRKWFPGILWNFLPGKRVSEEDFSPTSWPGVLGWPFLDLRNVTVPTEARNKISTKVAFQYSVLPTDFRTAHSRSRSAIHLIPAMFNAVQFDAGIPSSSRWRPRPKSRRR